MAQYIYITQSLNSFLRWWYEGLLHLVPDCLRKYMHRDAPQVWLTADTSSIRCRIVPQGITALAEIHEFHWKDADSVSNLISHTRSSGYETVLLLTSSQVLWTRLILPSAASVNLHQVLEYEMDRQTPFSLNQVYFVYRQVSTTIMYQIEIELAVTPRDILDQILTNLASYSIRPDRIDIESTGGIPAGFDLTAAGEDAAPKRFSNCNEVGLWLLAGCLVLVYQGLSVANQQHYINQLENETSFTHELLARYEALEQQTNYLDEQTEILADKVQSLPNAIQILDELSRLIPDDTWLKQLLMADDMIHITGESGNPSVLISILQESEILTDIQFQSPITHNKATTNDRFSISGRIMMIPDDHAS